MTDYKTVLSLAFDGRGRQINIHFFNNEGHTFRMLGRKDKIEDGWIKDCEKAKQVLIDWFDIVPTHLEELKKFGQYSSRDDNEGVIYQLLITN